MQDLKMCALIRQTWYEAAKRNLSDAERLSFYEVCFAYEFAGVEPTRQSCPYSSVLLMFDMVKIDLAKDAEKAKRIQERNRLNGSLGGRPAARRVESNETQQDATNPQEPNETQKNPSVLSGLPLHYTTLHNTTTTSSSERQPVLDQDFFEGVIWPAINTGGKYNSRHRACCALWLEMGELKKAAVKAWAEDPDKPRNPNPFFFLQDFPEPEPHYLNGREMENAWRDGLSVVQVKVGDRYKVVSQSDADLFGLEIVRTMAPQA